MATLALLVGGYLLITHVGALPDSALNVVRESATRPLSWALLAAMVLVGAVVPIARRLVTRRTLRSRVVLELLPSEEFDPPADAVVRLAAGLARTRRTLRGWLGALARAVRVRLDVDAEGRLHYRLEIPAHARHAVCGAYGEPVEVRPLDSVDGEDSPRRWGVQPIPERKEDRWGR